MKKNLIEKYVGLKVAQSDDFMSQLKETMAPADYIRKVMNLPLNVISSALKNFMEDRICKRYNIQRKSSIYYNPTIGQWLHEILEPYQAADFIEALSQASGLKPALFRKSTIGETVLPRWFLIDQVESFEAATGRLLLKDGDLAYLGEDYSYVELARFFAGDKSLVA